MSWEELRLADRTAGAEYGENTLRVAEALKKLSSPVSADSLPAVVWVYHPEDERANQSCESNLFQNERVGLALRKFRTLRLDVTNVRRREIREELEKATPSFLFFDPAGTQVGELKGKKATSQRGFTAALERTWSRSFVTKLQSYTKSYTRLLDRLDRLTAQQTILDQAKARLTAKPNPGKRRRIDREQSELDSAKERLARDERALEESVQLRPAYADRGIENETVKD